MKVCIRCGTEKPLDDFYKHPQMRDGRLNKCKECCKTYALHSHHEKSGDAEWVAKQRERGREKYHRLGYRTTNRRKTNAAQLLWVEKNPEKRRAHNAVNNAVRDGRLVRPDTCEECGEGGEIHAHHDDYSKPLDVKWLCVGCHMKRHRK